MAAFVNSVLLLIAIYCHAHVLPNPQLTFGYLIQSLFPWYLSFVKESYFTPCLYGVMTDELMCECICSMCSASGKRTVQQWPVCVRVLTASCCFLQDRPSRCGTWRLRRCIGWARQLFGTGHKWIFIPGCIIIIPLMSTQVEISPLLQPVLIYKELVWFSVWIWPRGNFIVWLYR